MILLVGRSGAGKDTIKKELIRLGCGSVVTYTTRPARDKEINGVSYHFISEEEFLNKKNEGFFVETTSYHVATGETWYYGTSKEDLNGDKVLIVNPYGLKSIKMMCSSDIISFLIDVDNKTLMKRLDKRGDNPEEVTRRMAADENDFADIYKYIDHIIKNNGTFSAGAVADEIAAIYKKERGGFA